MLVLVEKPAGEVPEPRARVARAAPEQDAAVPLDERLHAGDGFAQTTFPHAGHATWLAAMLAVRATARAVAPAVEEPHRG